MFKDKDWIFTDEVKKILASLIEEIENGQISKGKV